MKFLIVALTLVVSQSLFAQDEFSNQTLARVLRVANCQMKITQRPIVFGKDQGFAKSGKLVFATHEISEHLRRLRQERVLKISGVTKKHIQFEDSSINTACALQDGKKSCTRELNKLTLSDLEAKSGNNIKILCKRDRVLDI